MPPKKFPMTDPEKGHLDRMARRDAITLERGYVLLNSAKGDALFAGHPRHVRRVQLDHAQELAEQFRRGGGPDMISHPIILTTKANNIRNWDSAISPAPLPASVSDTVPAINFVDPAQVWTVNGLHREAAARIYYGQEDKRAFYLAIVLDEDELFKVENMDLLALSGSNAVATAKEYSVLEAFRVLHGYQVARATPKQVKDFCNRELKNSEGARRAFQHGHLREAFIRLADWATFEQHIHANSLALALDSHHLYAIIGHAVDMATMLRGRAFDLVDDAFFQAVTKAFNAYENSRNGGAAGEDGLDASTPYPAFLFAELERLYGESEPSNAASSHDADARALGRALSTKLEHHFSTRPWHVLFSGEVFPKLVSAWEWVDEVVKEIGRWTHPVYSFYGPGTGSQRGARRLEDAFYQYAWSIAARDDPNTEGVSPEEIQALQRQVNPFGARAYTRKLLSALRETRTARSGEIVAAIASNSPHPLLAHTGAFAAYASHIVAGADVVACPSEWDIYGPLVIDAGERSGMRTSTTGWVELVKKVGAQAAESEAYLPQLLQYRVWHELRTAFEGSRKRGRGDIIICPPTSANKDAPELEEAEVKKTRGKGKGKAKESDAPKLRGREAVLASLTTEEDKEAFTSNEMTLGDRTAGALVDLVPSSQESGLQRRMTQVVTAALGERVRRDARKRSASTGQAGQPKRKRLNHTFSKSVAHMSKSPSPSPSAVEPPPTPRWFLPLHPWSPPAHPRVPTPRPSPRRSPMAAMMSDVFTFLWSPVAARVERSAAGTGSETVGPEFESTASTSTEGELSPDPSDDHIWEALFGPPVADAGRGRDPEASPDRVDVGRCAPSSPVGPTRRQDPEDEEWHDDEADFAMDLDGGLHNARIAGSEAASLLGTVNERLRTPTRTDSFGGRREAAVPGTRSGGEERPDRGEGASRASDDQGGEEDGSRDEADTPRPAADPYWETVPDDVFWTQKSSGLQIATRRRRKQRA